MTRSKDMKRARENGWPRIRKVEVRRKWREHHTRLQRGKCFYCGVPMGENGPDSEATLDHIVPLGQGGRDSFKNTVAACDKCNREKDCSGPGWSPR
jgi:5-methylcytosine-specific restriction endonuclease McrA